MSGNQEQRETRRRPSTSLVAGKMNGEKRTSAAVEIDFSKVRVGFFLFVVLILQVV